MRNEELIETFGGCECWKITGDMNTRTGRPRAGYRGCTEGPVTQVERDVADGNLLVYYETEFPEGPQFSGMLRPVCAATLSSTADYDW